MGNFDEMVRLQKEMQEQVYGHDFDAMSNEERIQFIHWNVTALTDELHEALGEVGWKPWATNRHINEEAFVSELVDAWHFLMNLIIVSDASSEDFVKAYYAKRAKNIKRQEDGYDGVTGKCPSCRRALDDDAVLCAIEQVTKDDQVLYEIVNCEIMGMSEVSP